MCQDFKHRVLPSTAKADSPHLLCRHLKQLFGQLRLVCVCSCQLLLHVQQLHLQLLCPLLCRLQVVLGLGELLLQAERPLLDLLLLHAYIGSHVARIIKLVLHHIHLLLLPLQVLLQLLKLLCCCRCCIMQLGNLALELLFCMCCGSMHRLLAFQLLLGCLQLLLADDKGSCGVLRRLVQLCYLHIQLLLAARQLGHFGVVLVLQGGVLVLQCCQHLCCSARGSSELSHPLLKLCGSCR